MKRAKLIIVSLAAIFLASSFSQAQAQEQGQNESLGQHQYRMFSELGLSVEQQEKLEVNRKAQRQGFAKLMQAMREQREKLQNQLKDPKVTLAKLQPLIAEIKSLQGRLIDQRISSIFAVKEILTPEQFIKFQEKIQKMHKGRKGRFQEGQKNGTGRKCYKG